METEIATAYNPFTFLAPPADDGGASLAQDGSAFSKIINAAMGDANPHQGEDVETAPAADAKQDFYIPLKIPADSDGQAILPAVAAAASFLPFSITAHESPDIEPRPTDPDSPAPEDMDISDAVTAAIGAEMVDPIRPYGDLKAITGSKSPEDGPETGAIDPDMNRLPPPQAEKTQTKPAHNAGPAGQPPPPPPDKSAQQSGVSPSSTPLHDPKTKPLPSAPDMPSRNVDETASPAPISKTGSKGDIATATAAIVAPNIEDAKFDQSSLFHGPHQLRETEFIGARIVPEKVAHQIANAISHFAVKTDGNTVELLLTPKELGACRFKMLVIGDRVEVDLAVDNPDVLHLMRRQVDLLITELKVAGFNQTSINFSEMKNGDTGFSRSQREDQADQMHFDPEAEPEISLAAHPRPRVGAGRLHLKL